jgi:cell division septation protein DedD
MKNSWLIWLFVVVAIVTIFAVFNHQSVQKQKSLSEIFPNNEEVIPIDVEYEYIDTEPQTPSETRGTYQAETTAPAASETAQAESKVNITVERIEKPEVATNGSLPAFTIQIGSFRKQSQAEEVVAKLKNAGHDSFIVSRDLGEKGVWYRVYAGRFNTKADANAYLPKLQSMYKDAFVITPK